MMADMQTQHYHKAAGLARDGHYVEATVEYHRATLAKHLSKLDRTLERVSWAADRSRKQIAEGGTLYTLQEVRSDAARLIEEVTKVTSAQEALEDVRISEKSAKEDKSARSAKGRLDDAAAAIEGRDHELAALIRERAQAHLDAEQAEYEAAKAKAEEERAEARAKRNARPLGKVELEILAEILPGDKKKRSWSARKNKAIDSLVDRGFLLSDGVQGASGTFTLTPEGIKAKKAIS